MIGRGVRGWMRGMHCVVVKHMLFLFSDAAMMSCGSRAKIKWLRSRCSYVVHNICSNISLLTLQYVYKLSHLENDEFGEKGFLFGIRDWT